MFGPRKYLGQKKCCPKRIKALKKLGPKSLVKIRSVTAEILLMWLNVARNYVTWMNVTMTVGNC